MAQGVARGTQPVSQQLHLFGIGTQKKSNWRPEAPPSLAGVSRLALDTETTGLRWFSGDRPVGISGCLPDGHTFYLPFGHAGGNLDEGAVKRWAMCELRGKQLDFFNAPFDINMLYMWGVDLEAQGCTVSDAGHWVALLDDHRYGSSLDSVSKEYLGYGKLVDPGVSHMVDLHAEDVEKYARWDARLVHDLRTTLWPKLDEEDLQRARQLEDDCVPATAEMMRNGAPLDEELLDQWLVQSEKEYVQSLWALYHDLGFKVNPKSSPDMRRVFDKCGLKYPVNADPGSDFGKVTFAKRYLEKIDHPTIRSIRRTNRLASLRSKYLIPYKEDLKKNGVLRYALHQLRSGGEEEGDKGTISGRYSSSAYSTGDGVNIQQVAGKKYDHSVKEEKDWPYHIRKLFVPESGLWCKVDMEQVEYRLFVHYARPQKVLDAYEKDPHTNFHKITQAMIEQRRPITYELTKDLNFAGLFGAQLPRFAFMLGMTEKEAKPLYNIYHYSLPEARKLLKRAAKVAEDRGYVKTIVGRRARFPGKVHTHAAVNRVIQGSAADALKLKLAELHRASKAIGFKLRFTVHDEINGDVPNTAAAGEVGRLLDAQVLPTVVPLLWKVETGKNWQEVE